MSEGVWSNHSGSDMHPNEPESVRFGEAESTTKRNKLEKPMIRRRPLLLRKEHRRGGVLRSDHDELC
jgi:hypothetical protein